MSRKTDAAVARTIGIDTKNTLHLIGLDDNGAIVLRENSLQAGSQHGLRMLPQCLIDIEAGMATHYVAREPIALGHDVMKQVPQFMPGRSIEVTRTTSGMRSCKRALP
jgi:transposase